MDLLIIVMKKFFWSSKSKKSIKIGKFKIPFLEIKDLEMESSNES